MSDSKMIVFVETVFAKTCKQFFSRQLDFLSEPGVANETFENEPKSCLTVA